jgi:calcineurin-like phosphoesterase family protein
MRWFISDMHFYHKNIIDYCDRPFKSISDMHTAMITNWNKKVHNKDIVYILGDFSFGSYEDTREIMSRLKGRKRLIRGNHDYRFTSKDFVDMGFEDVRDYDFITLGNEKIIMSHYPYSPSKIKQWYYKWVRLNNDKDYYNLYLENRGKWLLHGHHHYAREGKYKDRQINVAVDMNEFSPVSENDILTHIQKENNATIRNRFNYVINGLRGRCVSYLSHRKWERRNKKGGTSDTNQRSVS